MSWICETVSSFTVTMSFVAERMRAEIKAGVLTPPESVDRKEKLR